MNKKDKETPLGPLISAVGESQRVDNINIAS